MRLEQLTYMVEIVKYSSMSLAAESLHISQSSLSVAIKQLEEELDTTIFVRSKRGTFLTEKGAELYTKIIKILDDIQSLYPYSTQEKALTGSLRILSILAFNPNIMKSISKLHSQNKQITHSIKLQEPEKINRKIAKKTDDYDIILTSMEGVLFHKHLKDLQKHFNVFLIAEDNLAIVMSPASPYCSQKAISISTLKKLPLISQAESDETDEFFSFILEKNCNTKFKSSVAVNDSTAAIDYISTGKAYSLSTPFAILQNTVQHKLDTKTLHLIPFEKEIPIAYVLLATKKDNTTAPIQNVFLQEFLNYYPKTINLSTQVI